MRIRIRIKISKKLYTKIFHPIKQFFYEVKLNRAYRFYTALAIIVIFTLTILFQIQLSGLLKSNFLANGKGDVYAANLDKESIENELETIPNASVKGASASSKVKKTKSDIGFVDLRVLTLEDYFNSYGSPLAEYSDEFIKACEKYDVQNWQLLPAIAINETNGCQTGESYEQKNCWGWGGAGYNRWRFNSFEEAIDIITRSMIRGYGNNRMNAKDIQRTYCGEWCMEYGWRWAKGVNYYVFRVNDFGERYGLERTNEIYNFDE